MKKLIVTLLLLMPVGVVTAYFTGPYTAVNQAAATMIQHESLKVNTDRTQSADDIQKFYDHDERVICYVYVNVGISCVNDNTQ